MLYLQIQSHFEVLRLSASVYKIRVGQRAFSPYHCILLLYSPWVLSRSAVLDSFETPWTVAHQGPLSMGFPGQEYWSGLPFPPLRDLPDPEIQRTFLVSSTLAGDFLPPCHPASPSHLLIHCSYFCPNNVSKTRN